MAARHRNKPTLRIPLPAPSVVDPQPAKEDTSPHNAVFIDSLPKTVHESLLKHLLSPLGQILSISRHKIGDDSQVVIVFASPDDARAAARQLDGNTIFGPEPLSVTLGHVSTTAVINNVVQTSQQRPHKSSTTHPQPDTLAKKNLYISNIPHDCTEQELHEAFSAFGTVEHVCVLATTDSMARRRAFIDMRSGAAARTAAANLHGTRVRGYAIDISFAHIQRSSSVPDSFSPLFSPKTTMLPRPSDSYFPAVPEMPATRPIESSPLRHQIYTSASTSTRSSISTVRSSISTVASCPPPPPYDLPRPSRTIRIDNITRQAASDSIQLGKYFQPYGVLVNVELIRNIDNPDRAWAQVAYNKAEDAEKAILHLDGRVIGGASIRISRLDDHWLVRSASKVRPTSTRQTEGSPASLGPEDSLSNRMTPIAETSPTKSGSMPLPVPQGGDGAWPSLKFNTHSPASKRTALSARSTNAGSSSSKSTFKSGAPAIFFPPAPTSQDNAEDMIHSEKDLSTINERLAQLGAL